MNNPIIISTGIAMIGLVLSIFGAAWLNQNLMNKRIDDLKMYLDAKFQAVDERIARVEERMARIERMLDSILKPEIRR